MQIIDKAFMDKLCAEAAAAPRLRAHFNLHPTLEDPLHRLLIATVPGTYIRPHRHLAYKKFEFMAILRGRAVILTFNDAGVVKARYEMTAGGDLTAVELDCDVWHAFVPLTEQAVVCEVKPGPYLKLPESDFASWAPEEGSAEAAEFVKWFLVAAEGEAFPIYGRD